MTFYVSVFAVQLLLVKNMPFSYINVHMFFAHISYSTKFCYGCHRLSRDQPTWMENRFEDVAKMWLAVFGEFTRATLMKSATGVCCSRGQKSSSPGIEFAVSEHTSRYLYNKTAIRKKIDEIHQRPVCKIKDIACGRSKMDWDILHSNRMYM